VPDDVLEGFEKGNGDNEGKLRFTFKYPDLFPTLKFALDADTRQKVFIENENKVCCDVLARWVALMIPVQPKRPPLQRSYRPP
jgi:hypothetical protein